MAANVPMYDEDFYCQDLVIMVENRLFKVPRRLFDESPIFGDMFAVAQNAPLEGSSDTHPLRLDGVSAADFKHLLQYLFPLPSRPPFSPEGWTGVLRLSTMWNFARAQQDAVEALHRMVHAPEERIRLARDFDIPGWLAPALKELIIRPEPMGPSDVNLLGVDWVLKVAALREQYGPHISNLAGSFLQETMAVRSRSMHFARTSAGSGGFIDAIIPGPDPGSQHDRVQNKMPHITDEIVVAEFDLAK